MGTGDSEPAGKRPGPMRSTERFTGRVEAYARHRPSYPAELLGVLGELGGLRPEHLIVDLGSGTGILTRLFLEHGNTVHAVEPNRAMRAAAEEALGGEPGFRSVAGTAEDTSLPEGVADWVVAGQAFHWFDPEETRREARRILRPGGMTAFTWNRRRAEGTPFRESYEAFLRTWGTDYLEVKARWDVEGALMRFFGEGGWEVRELENAQVLDREGLKGRLLSSSYVPGVGHPRHEAMLEALDRLFEEHAEEGTLRMEYVTRVVVGRVTTR